MNRPGSLYGLERTGVRADANDPDLRVFKSNVYVRDHQRSIDFFVEKLGFDVVVDLNFDGQGRWVAVAPANGSTMLALMVPAEESADYALIGSDTRIAFISEDIYGTHARWSARGVHFDPAPHEVAWGGVYSKFKDVDGNVFELVSSDAITKEIEEQRRSMQQKAEAERRSEQELAIAKEVQARLFPQTRPAMRSLEYAGVCLQARHVGGDYFDFLALGESRLGLMVGDVSGKGIAAALLMANLQANVRSQSSMAVDHPECMLASVNDLFFANSTAGSYATFLFAEYDDRTYQLRYANCGHLPALVLRADGSIVRLESTGRLLGMFGAWECVMRDFQMREGDTLLLYTDGVTECFDAAEEEFGEERLITSLKRNQACSSHDLLAAIAGELRAFGTAEQGDDITLIVAQCRGVAG